jgi:hypothetical protein
MTWETCPMGINTGGWGLSVQTETLQKFGQLYLQKGTWNGRQLLPATWVEEATTFKIQQPGGADLEKLKRESDWHQGYCYQFWRCRHNAFRGDGAFGQYTIVMPEQDAVIAITSESASMQGEMNLIWEHLLPAMQTADVPANRSASDELSHQLRALALAPPKGQAPGATAERISGKPFAISTNEGGIQNVAFRFTRKDCVFTLKDAQGTYPITCGLEKWADGETTMPGTPPKLTSGGGVTKSKIAASGTWKDGQTFEMIWRFCETPHHDTVTCHFNGDEVSLEFINSITQLSPPHKEKRPPLSGKLSKT